MSFPPYLFLFTDQNANRQFSVQPYSTNGPATPTTGKDPNAAGINTTLYLYGKGSPNYGDRIQENMIYMLEHFSSQNEPSFPVAGQVWFKKSTNPISQPFQLQVYNPYKYTIVNSSGNNIFIQSNDGTESLSTVLTRFTNLNNQSQNFNVYSITFSSQFTFVQTAAPIISGSQVELTVQPSTGASSALTGMYIGGWEEMYQGNAQINLRIPLNANNLKIINIATPTNSGDAANKAYVDNAVSGGTLSLADLSDVVFQTPGMPQPGSYLFFDGTDWTDKPITSFPFLPLTGGTMLGTINMGNNFISNLLPPINPNDASTKQYVDNQLLSNQNVSFPSGLADQNLLVYSSSLGDWTNETATQAGLLPLTGGVMTGPISMGTGITLNQINNLATPTSSTDAATKGYVDSTELTVGITSSSYNNMTGVLTINQTGTPNTITVSGFLPTSSNNILPASSVDYTPVDLATTSVLTAPGLFFQATIGDYANPLPNIIPDPINLDMGSMMDMVDNALGNFTIAKQRIVIDPSGTAGVFNIYTGGGPINTIAPAPLKMTFIPGSYNLQIYLNGIKQLASDTGFYEITGYTTGLAVSGATCTIGASTITLTGNYIRQFHPRTRVVISGTSTTNDGKYIVTAAVFSASITTITVVPDTFNTSFGTVPFVSSGTGTVTSGTHGIFQAMETGYLYNTGTNVKTFTVNVNGNATTVTVSIDTNLTNITTFGLLVDAVNAIVLQQYINPIVGVTTGGSGTFVVAGNRTTQFPAGQNFHVRYSSVNDSLYTVSGAGSTYNSGTNKTTIPISSSIPDGTVNGILFKDEWGFTMGLRNGVIVFFSNISGTGSAVTVTDSGLFAGITGITWPVTVTTPLVHRTNPVTPQTWAYQEIGLIGYQSPIFVFNTDPSALDIMEIVVEREIIYKAVNPFSTAVTA